MPTVADAVAAKITRPSHKHHHLAGGSDTRQAAPYSDGFVDAILRGLKRGLKEKQLLRQRDDAPQVQPGYRRSISRRGPNENLTFWGTSEETDSAIESEAHEFGNMLKEKLVSAAEECIDDLIADGNTADKTLDLLQFVGRQNLRGCRFI